MTRTAVAVDRLAALLVAGMLIVGGAALLIWNTGLFAGAPEVITAPALVRASATAWWPWAATGVGLVLVVLALRWLASHRPAAGIGRTLLHETGDAQPSGRTSIDVGALAAATADAMSIHPAIRSASGKAVVDRGRRTLQLTATAESPHHLTAAVRAADDAVRDAVTMLGDSTLAARTLVRVGTSRERQRRLH